MGDQYQTLNFIQDDQVGISFAIVDANGAAVNITNYSLMLQIQKATTPTGKVAGDCLEKAGTITNAAGGLATFSFVPGDFNFVGLCDAQLKITDSSGNVRRLRGFGFRIYPRFK